MALTLCLYFTALDAWNGTAHLIIIHPGTPLQFPAQLHATQQMTQYLPPGSVAGSFVECLWL